MIIPHPSMRLPDKYAIDNAVVKMDYTGYVPYNLVTDLSCAVSHYLMGCDPTACIVEKNAYTTAFKALIEYIRFENVRGYNPVNVAVGILKKVHKKMDLRQVERAKSSGKTFKFDFPEEQQNYKFDLSTLDDDVLGLLEIEKSNKPINELKLTPELEEILTFYDGMKVPGEGKFTEKKRVTKQMSSVSQVSRIRKYKFGMPTFKADLALKKFDVTVNEDIAHDCEEIVICIDISSSAVNNDKYQRLVKATLLRYISKFVDSRHKITICFFGSIVWDLRLITAKKDLIDLYKSDWDSKISGADITSVFRYLGKKLSRKNILFLTDGHQTYGKLLRNRGNKFHFISLKENECFNGISVDSGGRFIVI